MIYCIGVSFSLLDIERLRDRILDHYEIFRGHFFYFIFKNVTLIFLLSCN